MDLGIAGKWALVCGASKGLGRGCAEALVREGVNLVVNARNADELQRTATCLMAEGAAAAGVRGQNSSKPQVLVVAADITTPEGRAAAFGVAGGPGRGFDIVVTNAGGPPPGDFRGWNRDAWISAVDANMLTPIELIRATVDGMAGRGYGRIVNITSSAVKAPIDILGLSNGARSGLTGFVAGVARSAIAARGVTLNNLLPGKFDTDRLAGTIDAAAAKAGRSVDDVRRAQQAAIPAGRYGTPQEFGAICAFLCSVHAGYITGQNILADGGAYPGTF
ncbi:SDR family oxidoreductase [Alicycliphilus denitrificans]|jgi:3-oxoacyl-[acyl-carrier protein] reductase|uniref:Short-chain dehydrogenase/reductase SDR n=1 Tax=Alicycliphilus denitrificans (strain DSM 14773 / CIP 107495 / K601) TaxID=596154 RepID=F4GEA0_ALIDK|nr:SDR family oxidoreductase [Alicycliphilus denitrificans]AEB86062.1 short-chain dehydrogenase/reductase SDR [Alicycliphilus denitrificans K601]MCC6631873.1 SDR family oxidoreductase [Gammaproteobacteria bacterium]